MAESSLKDKATKGAIWNTIDKFAYYGISFIIGIVLARLLSPVEYGLIGIVLIFTSIFNTILDGGLSTALIRKDKVDDVDYCTVFYTNIVLSVVLSLTLFLCAPLISEFFRRPELTPYTRVMSAILIVNALSITQQARLTKCLDFKTQTKISIISNVLSGTVGILMAVLGYGVWALVFQQLSNRIMTTILLWFFNKWYPRLMFSWNRFKDLFDFSSKLLISQIISSLSNQLYQAVVGRIYSPATLGQYTRAHQYVNLSSSIIGDVISKVSLPVLSEIQNEDTRLINAYKLIIKITMLISCFILLGMAACAESLIYVLVGEQWMECVPMMQILCLSFVIYPMHLLNINMLLIQGRSDLNLILQIVKNILSIGPILLGIFCGIYWMLIGSVAISWISLILNAYYSGKKHYYTWWMQLKDVAPSFILALIMAIPVYAISFLSWSQFIILPLQIVLGVMLAIFLCELFKRDEYLQLKEIAMSYLKKT